MNLIQARRSKSIETHTHKTSGASYAAIISIKPHELIIGGWQTAVLACFSRFSSNLSCTWLYRRDSLAVISERAINTRAGRLYGSSVD